MGDVCLRSWGGGGGGVICVDKEKLKRSWLCVDGTKKMGKYETFGKEAKKNKKNGRRKSKYIVQTVSSLKCAGGSPIFVESGIIME